MSLRAGASSLQFLADLADFLVDAGIAFEVVRQDRAVKFFVADARLAPVIIKHAAGAAGNELIREQPDDAGSHQRIDVLPVDLAGFLFNNPETAVAVGRFDVGFFQRTEYVNVARQFGGFGLDGRLAFNGNEIDGVGHVEVVKFPVERAQVDGDGMVGAKLVQHIGLHANESHDGVAAKPVPVQQQSRVVGRGRGHGHGHVLEGGDNLTQITQPQLVVQALNGLVLQFQPVLPFQTRILIERPFGLMSAEAVVNLPGNQLRMVSQRPGHVFDQPLGSVPVGIIVEAGRPARAFVFDQTVLVERQNPGVLSRQPDGGSSGGRAQDNLDVLILHDVHDAAQPLKIVFTLLGFADAPGIFADADNIDAGLGHQFGIMFPSPLGFVSGAAVREDPLLRIIVNAKKHNLASRFQQDTKSNSPRWQSQNHRRRPG